MLTNVDPTPATWPARYRMHKYWSRKPSGPIAARIAAATVPGDLVLDPFCGSGVAAIEAAALGRRALAIDTNPFAVFLARTTARAVAGEALAAAGRAVLAAARGTEGCWHRTSCRRCGSEATLAGTAYRGVAPTAVLVRCAACGGVAREHPTAADRALIAASDRAGDGDAPRPPVRPGWQTRKLTRAGLRDFGELFTARNLRAFAALRGAIVAAADPATRDLLLLALTGALAQGSRMMADHSGTGGGHSWKINIYWLPERSLELDPFRCFANRLARVVAGADEVSSHLAGQPEPRFRCHDARRLGDLVAPGTVRYVFADPPYGGEGIQYAELSALWCGWLDPPLTPRYDEEIGENPVQGRDRSAFADGLLAAFLQVREAIAEDGRMTVTFASRDPRSWDALETALREARFRIDERREVVRSAPGLTERTTGGGTRADAWLECRPVS